MSSAADFLNSLLGLSAAPKDVTTLQMTLRAFIVFAATIFIVRVGDKRFLARKTAYDAVLSFILASMLSRAINGSAPFFPTLICGLALVLAHRLLSYAAARSHRFGSLLKGHDTPLIADGQIDRSALSAHNISIHDLREDLRLEGIEREAEVRSARLERSGDISVIKK